MSGELLEVAWGWAWRTSLEALPLAVVALVGWRLRVLPAAWRWWVPALFFVRLAVPRAPEVGWQVWGVASLPAAKMAVAEPAVQATGSALPGVLSVMWALGCAGVAGWVIFSHWRLARAIRREGGPACAELMRLGDWAAARMGLSRRVPMRVMPGWTTMAVCGWLRPVVLLPGDLGERFTEGQLRGMFLHEMAHVRRRDVLWTWLALGLCALHWFNPLAWLALRRLHADRELACDAAALGALEPAARQDYGEALLLCLRSPAVRCAPALAPFFRRFPEIKQRLQHIMTPTSPTLRNRLFTALLVPTLAVLTFTTARAQRDGDVPKPATPETPAAERVLRDGEKPKAKLRDGEGDKGKAREGQRDGDRKANPEREGDGARKAGARDGDQPKKAMSDGERSRSGPRDGERKRSGPSDGERKRAGAKDGDVAKKGVRDGDAAKPAPREGEREKAGEEKPEAR